MFDTPLRAEHLREKAVLAGKLWERSDFFFLYSNFDKI